jgi:hypothetical protein
LYVYICIVAGDTILPGEGPGNVVVELMFYKIALLSLLSYHENIKNKTKLSYTVIMVVNISTTLNEMEWRFGCCSSVYSN